MVAAAVTGLVLLGRVLEAEHLEVHSDKLAGIDELRYQHFKPWAYQLVVPNLTPIVKG